MIEIVGWTSSVVLLLTIAKQIEKQWRDENSQGVSAWLFIGQFLASLGFTVYSAALHNWVFVVTNVVLALAALIGLAIVIRHRRRRRR